MLDFPGKVITSIHGLGEEDRAARVHVGSRRGRPAEPPAGQFTGLNRGLFLAGARVTFKLELKVTRGPRGVNKWTAPGRGPSGSRARRPKKRPKTAREQPGKAPFVKCDQGIKLRF